MKAFLYSSLQRVRLHLRRLAAGLFLVLASLLPSMAAGQSTYLTQVKTSSAGTVKIYATSDPQWYRWTTLEYGGASVRATLSLIDAEAARSGGVYALEGGTTFGTVTRYTVSGAIDTLYAARGVLTVGPGNTRLHEALSGHLYVLGERLARYTPNGQLDTEFASQPAVTVCPTGTRPHDLYAQSDGALVLCLGTTGSSVSRITTAGEIRTDYGEGGRASVPGGVFGRLHLDAGGNVRVHTWTPGVFAVSAFDSAGRPLHAPVSLPGVSISPSSRLRDPHYARVFGDGTTWVTTTFPSPKANALGLQGVTPDGQTYGPWPVAPPTVNNGFLEGPPLAGPLVPLGSTGVAVHYQYNRVGGISGHGPYLLDLRDAPGLTSAPIPVSPQDGFVSIPNATLTWRRVADAVSYDVSLVSYDMFSTQQLPLHPVVHGSTTDTTLTLPVRLLNEWGRWAWRVRSQGADGRAGAWSTASIFRTQPPQPTLVTRYRGSQVTAPVTLIWNDIPDPSIEYFVDVSSSRTFSTSVWSSVAPQGSPTVTTPTLSGGVYYWRVNARAKQGVATYIYSPYSDLDSFVVAPANGLLAFPEAPVAASVTFPLWISWSAAPDATAYDWQVSSTSTFATIADSGRSTLLRAEAQVPAGAYYWRVRGRAGATVGAFSHPAPFSVSLPLVPVLLSPDAVTPSPVTVAWQASAGAERYRVHIRSSNTLVLDSLVSATQTSIRVPLTQHRVYTVSVAAESGTNMVWSTARSFTTQGTVVADSPERSGASIAIAPNPADDDLVVRSTSADLLRYELVSILGVVVARGSLSEGATTIPRNGLSPGVYVLRVYQSGQPAQALRVVLL